MQLQVGKRQSQMCFPVVPLKLNGGLKIRDGLCCFVKIIQYETAIDVPGRHLRIVLQSTRVVIESFMQLSVVSMYVARNQRQILVVRKNRLKIGRTSCR